MLPLRQTGLEVQTQSRKQTSKAYLTHWFSAFRVPRFIQFMPIVLAIINSAPFTL